MHKTVVRTMVLYNTEYWPVGKGEIQMKHECIGHDYDKEDELVQCS